MTDITPSGGKPGVLMAEIVERNRRSCACPRHFYPHDPEGYRIGQKVQCAHCGVNASLTEIGSYLRGYMAAGGNPADVMPDWEPRESVNGNIGVIRNVR